MSFWQQLPKPIIGLAPMDGVSDSPFRTIQKRFGSPDIMFTEFTSVEGVCHGALALLKDFLYEEEQRPLVAQIYGLEPDFFRQTAIICCELGFDGIDINMGCPAKKVAHRGAGAGLINTPELAQRIIRATKQGVQEYLNGVRARNCDSIKVSIISEIERRHTLLSDSIKIRNASESLPVSVKTRIGYTEDTVSTWIPALLEEQPAAISLHGRTFKQMYQGLADWGVIAKASEVCKNTGTLLIGNGDIHSRAEALEKINTYTLDGVLVGRASIGNPLCFRDGEYDLLDYCEIALQHAKLFEETYHEYPKYFFGPMRKHLAAYIKHIRNASGIRALLVRTNSSDEAHAIIHTLLQEMQINSEEGKWQ
jgi:tRNA-dihydrouridine synthase